jgi:hypothetical protein
LPSVLTDVCLTPRFMLDLFCRICFTVAERLDDVQLDVKADAKLLTACPTYSVNNFVCLCKYQQLLLLKIQKSFRCCVTERKLPSLFTAGAEMHRTANVLCGSFVCVMLD